MTRGVVANQVVIDSDTACPNHTGDGLLNPFHGGNHHYLVLSLEVINVSIDTISKEEHS